MGNYIVSARKYRPKGFEEVVGQDHITTTLKNAIEQDQLAQALLFCGPRGVGKTTCARIVANMINDFDPEKDGSSTAMNIYELDAASNNSVDDIRNLIDQVRYPPQYGKYKVYIIDEVHMLSASAFNAFLKTLEEPPPYAIFILATTEKHKVIPTILSRCQIFDFNRINISDITERLTLIAEKEKIKAEPEALHLISQKADGALRDALSLFDLIVTYSSDESITYKNTAENLHILDYDYYFKITDHFLHENLSDSLLLFNEILKKGFDGQNFINGLAEHLRNLMVCKDPETIILLEVSENIKQKYLDQSSRTSKSFLLSALNILNQSDLSYKNARNQRLLVELTLMKLVHLRSALHLTTPDVQPAQDLKKKQQPEKPAVKGPEKKPSSTSTDTNHEKEDEALNKERPPEVDPEIKNETADEKPLTATQPPSSSETKLSQQKKKTLTIPKIRDLKERSLKDTPQENLSDDDQVTDQGPANPVTSQDLQKAWKKFREQLRGSGMNKEFNLMSKDFSLEENFRIIIKIDNSLEEDILARFKPSLLQFLRKELKNTRLNVETSLKATPQDQKLYTNTDKFNYLAEKNPTLLDLKNKFGLDTEF